MANAGVKAVASIADLHARGSNLVIEVLCGDFTQWEHYPPDDVRDPQSTRNTTSMPIRRTNGTSRTTGISICSWDRKECQPVVAMPR